MMLLNITPDPHNLIVCNGPLKNPMGEKGIHSHRNTAGVEPSINKTKQTKKQVAYA